MKCHALSSFDALTLVLYKVNINVSEDRAYVGLGIQ